MKPERLFCFSSPADGTPTWATHFFFKVTVFVVVPVWVSACVCLNLPTALCRQLCDRTQGAEGPLGAAVRKGCRITAERAETHSKNSPGKGGGAKSQSAALHKEPTWFWKSYWKRNCHCCQRHLHFPDSKEPEDDKGVEVSSKQLSGLYLQA